LFGISSFGLRYFRLAVLLTTRYSLLTASDFELRHLEQVSELLQGKTGLRDDTPDDRLGYVPAMERHGQPEMRIHPMLELNVTAGLVVNLEACSVQSA
jgi:hypothetical protein